MKKRESDKGGLGAREIYRWEIEREVIERAIGKTERRKN